MSWIIVPALFVHQGVCWMFYDSTQPDKPGQWGQYFTGNEKALPMHTA